MKTILLKSVGELFELWKTNKNFQAKYPYLYNLYKEFHNKLDRYDYDNGIQYYLKTCRTNKLSDDDFKTYIYPYYDNTIVKNDTIDFRLITGDAHNYKCIIMYILEKKLPVISTGSLNTIYFCTQLTVDELVEFFKYCPLPSVDFSICEPKLLLKIFMATKLECYKPTAYDFIRHHSNMEENLQIIKDNNLDWIEGETKFYNFVKQNKDSWCSKCSLFMWKVYFELICKWNERELNNLSDWNVLIEGCKKYNIDINVKPPAGNLLIFFAVRTVQSNPERMKILLDNGAKLFDNNGQLIRDYGGVNIYHYAGVPLHNFLLDYYKDNKIIGEKLQKEYYMVFAKRSGYCVVEIEEDPVIEPEVKSMLDNIKDQTIRDKMTAYYVKLLSNK